MKRPRPLAAAGLAALAGLSVWLANTSSADTTGSAVTTTVRATATRIGDHPAYVRAVVVFRGTVTANGEVFASDASPQDGRAALRLVLAGARTIAPDRHAFGLSVSVRRNARGLAIRLASAPLRFKYLSWSWVGSMRLAIDMWKSSPPGPAAEIRRGSRGCLTLASGSVSSAGVAIASGRERGVFEHQFRVLVRGSDGRVLAARTVHSLAGRWRATFPVHAARRQAGTLEAAAFSPADGALTCLVQQRVVAPRKPAA